MGNGGHVTLPGDHSACVLLTLEGECGRHHRAQVERLRERRFGSVDVTVDDEGSHLGAMLARSHLVGWLDPFGIADDEPVVQPLVVLDGKTIE